MRNGVIKMEKRKFGKTGLETTLLGFGGFHLIEIPFREVDFLLNTYLDAGGNYIETAAGYGDGKSEVKIGKAIASRRAEFILTSKSSERRKEGFLTSLNNSLENLKTDYLDLILMHAVGSINDLDTILGPGGAMEGFITAQKAGKVKFVGISMHGQPDILIEALKQYSFDAVMSTINYYDRFNYPEIEDKLVPLALRQGTAIILMKPVADGFLWRSAPQAFQYAFSQPVSVVVSGINTREMLSNDLKYADEYKPMTENEKEWLFKNASELGNYVCRQCKECFPCPEGISIPEIFKYEGYFDRQMADGLVNNPADYALSERLRFWFNNKQMAIEKYAALQVNAEHCTKCGKCMSYCPYNLDIMKKLEIADYKMTDKKFY